MNYRHVPVLLEEVIENLNIKKGGRYIDATLGGGGYTFEIARRAGKDGLVAAFDLDAMAIDNAKVYIKKNRITNVILRHENFKNISSALGLRCQEREIDQYDGIVFDLGLSSAQLEDRTRGFSFNVEQSPLIMAFNKDSGRTAKDLVNGSSEEELKRILSEYGEEKYASRVARAIVSSRKSEEIKTVGDLVSIIRGAVPAEYRNKKIDPATKTFQALRIAVNEELDSLQKALPQAVGSLRTGGRLAVVTFHSLEDRIVKQYFKRESTDCLCPPRQPICTCNHQKSIRIIAKKPITPGSEELKDNPRARSAKLRVVQKI